MTLRIAWQIHDSGAHAIAAGVEHVDERFVAVDPYDTTIIVADKIERALLEHMAASRIADVQRRARNLARRHERREARAEAGT